MRYFLYFSYLLLTLFLNSCTNNELNLIPLNSTILAFGDSLTTGKGVAKKYSYPSVLAKLTKHKVINAGISGETTKQGLKRFSRVLAAYSPGLVILVEGGNDILRNISSNKIKQNLTKMIEIAIAKNIPVVLVGIPKKGLFLKTANFYQQLADKHQLIFIKNLVTKLLSESKYKSDLIHLNQLGYRKMAEKIYQTLVAESLLY